MKQTSYNANMRGCYAGLGMTYMENVATLGVASTDIFIGQQPYPSLTIDPMVWVEIAIRRTTRSNHISSRKISFMNGMKVHIRQILQIQKQWVGF